MTIILNKQREKLRVKEAVLPLRTSTVLGNAIDPMALPEGHLSCVRCKGHLFECWIYHGSNALEMGCIKCNESYRMAFPLDVKLPGNTGRFTCRRHPDKAMVLIHNVDVVCVGCEKCKTEIQIFLKTKTNLVMAD